MRRVRNPGRVAGFWYLSLILLGPLRLIYIPSKLFVPGDATATTHNIATHESLFRLGIASDLLCAIVLVLLTLAFYRLFADVDRNLAALVVFFGGVMPALLYFTGATTDLAALTVVQGGGGYLSAFTKPQQDALAMFLIKLHSLQNVAAETLWGVWLFPLGALVYRSRFLPRWIGIWLGLGGVAYVAMSFVGVLWPQHQDKVFTLSQPFTFAEIGLTAWLLIKGSKAALPPQVTP